MKYLKLIIKSQDYEKVCNIFTLLVVSISIKAQDAKYENTRGFDTAKVNVVKFPDESILTTAPASVPGSVDEVLLSSGSGGITTNSNFLYNTSIGLSVDKIKGTVDLSGYGIKFTDADANWRFLLKQVLCHLTI